jgi:hypothetical protein
LARYVDFTNFSRRKLKAVDMNPELSNDFVPNNLLKVKPTRAEFINILNRHHGFLALGRAAAWIYRRS